MTLSGELCCVACLSVVLLLLPCLFFQHLLELLFIIRESVDSLCSLYVGMAPTRPLLTNVTAYLVRTPERGTYKPFRHITWPTSVSIHDNTLKSGKIHRYNDIREIAKTLISPSSSSSSSSSNGLAQNWYKYLP